MLLRIKKIFFPLLFYAQAMLSQDVHFSQTGNTQTFLNPAYAGIINGDYRLTTSYRDQWKSISFPYRSVFSAFDIAIHKNDHRKGFWGLGGLFISDQAGTSKMAFTQFSIQLAYTINLNSTNQLGIGIQPGFIQRSIHAGSLKWGSQFDGDNYNSGLASGENNINQQASFFDIGAGLLWNSFPSENLKISAGASIDHANQPQYSFLGSTDERLPYKITLHATSQLNFFENKYLFIIPQIVYVHQNTYNEFLFSFLVKGSLGLNSKYTNAFSAMAIYGGITYRNNDAIILLTKFDANKNFSFGISYDINISELNAASNKRGGVELYIGYKTAFDVENYKFKKSDYIF
jgi:type IX secretion system PorP/SprF family membrane protein